MTCGAGGGACATAVVSTGALLSTGVSSAAAGAGAGAAAAGCAGGWTATISGDSAALSAVGLTTEPTITPKASSAVIATAATRGWGRVNGGPATASSNGIASGAGATPAMRLRI